MSNFLDCWGEIAAELGVSEKTAIRYRCRGLPIVYDPAGHPTTTKELLLAWKTNTLHAVKVRNDDGAAVTSESLRNES